MAKRFQPGTLLVGAVIALTTLGAASPTPSPSATGPDDAARRAAERIRARAERIRNAPRASPRTWVEFSPQHPCIGDVVRVTGRFPGASRVELWLAGPAAWADDRDPFRAEVGQPMPGGVRLGSATPDGDGDFALTFVLAPRLAPVTTGGELVVRPGDRLALFAPHDGTYAGWRGRYDLEVAPPGAGCADAPGSPEPRISLDPPIPCMDDEVTLRGEHFSGAVARVTAKEVQMRFGLGPTASRDVAVRRDGSFELRFRPREAFVARDRPVLRGDPEGEFHLFAFDPTINRTARLAFAMCNPGLRAAIDAASLPLSGAFHGSLRTGASPPNAEPTFTGLVIGSSADLTAAARRLGLPPDVFAPVPAMDFKGHVGLLAAYGPGAGPRELEIVAVAPGAHGAVAHPVAWEHMDPFGEDWTIAFTLVPRTALPIRFAPLVRAARAHRALLPAGRVARSPGYLSLYPGRPPQFTPQR